MLTAVTLLRDIFDWLGERIGGVLVLSLVIVAGIWGFIALTDKVKEGSTQRFDERVIVMLRDRTNLSRPIGPPWLAEVGRDITALGGVAVLSLITLAVVGFLLLSRKHGTATLVSAAAFGGLLLSVLLKHLVDRDRPQLVPHLSYVVLASFPSGHSMMSATVYLTLGALLARVVQRRRLKLYFVVLAMGLTFLVGVSRVYMGVHYPTDVLAGWTAGLVWALLCWLVARYLQGRGTVEPEEPG